MNSFNKLGIKESVVRTLSELEFKEPTYIQEKTIPLILEGKDVIGQSETGSGKTLAFGCGLIQNKGRGLYGIALTPTRELAEQVSKALMSFSKYDKLNITAVYGGVSMNPQIDAFERANIVVATPGRFLDHMRRGNLNLSNVSVLVLDEADRMVDMGFSDDVEAIMNACPKKRQTLMFSATMSADIERIKRRFMNDPQKVMAKQQVDPTKLKQVYYDVRSNAKFSLAVHLLAEGKGTSMIFCNTRTQVDFISKNLQYNGLDAIAIHGGFTQAKRSSNLDKFSSQHASILVCTDVAARGLDIPDVKTVYNYDIPKNPKEYVHRIGRTARAGKEGVVINLLSERDHENFGRVQREFSGLEVLKMDIPKYERAKMKIPSRDDERGGRGRNDRGSSRGRFGRGRSDGRRSFSSSRGRPGRSGQGRRDDDRSGNEKPRERSGRREDRPKKGNRPPRTGNFRKKPSNNHNIGKSSDDTGRSRNDNNRSDKPKFRSKVKYNNRPSGHGAGKRNYR